MALQAVALQAAAQVHKSSARAAGSYVIVWEVNGGGQVPMKTEDGTLMGWDKHHGVESHRITESFGL